MDKVTFVFDSKEQVVRLGDKVELPSITNTIFTLIRDSRDMLVLRAESIGFIASLTIDEGLLYGMVKIFG